VWGKPIQTLERFEPPKKRQPLFPLEIRKGWRELPEWGRFFAVVLAIAHFILFTIWAYFKFRGW
jgi:hypothetical protein